MGKSTLSFHMGAQMHILLAYFLLVTSIEAVLAKKQGIIRPANLSELQANTAECWIAKPKASGSRPKASLSHSHSPASRHAPRALPMSNGHAHTAQNGKVYRGCNNEKSMESCPVSSGEAGTIAMPICRSLALYLHAANTSMFMVQFKFEHSYCHRRVNSKCAQR